MISGAKRGLKGRFISISIAASIVLLFALLVVPRGVTAADMPLTVWGTVKDSAGTPIVGASVSATIVKTGGVTLTDPDGTTTGGIYQIFPDFTPNTEYNAGDTVRVTATCGLGSKSVDHVITIPEAGEGLAFVAIQYDTVIPEFGSSMGLIVATFVAGLVALVVVGKKRA